MSRRYVDMKQPLISVIIPVYGVEKYIAQCLESVINQTYKNLEIILVDDGSPDRCGKICDEYQKKDGRIRVIHKKNEGVARARNDGLDCATGDYISFIDSDDWIAPDAYEKLYRGLQENGADCAIGGCVNVIEKDVKLEYPADSFTRKTECRDSKEVVKNLLLRASAVWNRLFKREIFETIRFPENRINDDEVVALHAYVKCKKIVMLNEPTYYYRIRKNSITTGSFTLRKMDMYYNSLDNYAFIQKTMPDLLTCAEYKVFRTRLYCYLNLKRLKKTEETAKIRKDLKTEIRKSRKNALGNPYLPFSLKAATILCCL